ncbi:hypothetical protein L873DRAFT_1400827 [Choiromyces venosus 120613-1]|uniref:DUF2470 domain-containing protein n=1 Tax=Choiromyces venosus 120613-1 TaxID=1336337 RepID=A0A3N4J8R6_9PEZI|nr:hypothetical protein L873DRAFT_1400827 [Choiromyces venosus 120613-1]
MATKIDPTTLLSHPIPVRNLILQIPPGILTPLLTHHAQAFEPQDAIVSSITPEGLTVTYLQPLREAWYNPIPRSAFIPFTPPLPPLPPPASASESENFEWEEICAGRLREMSCESGKVIDDRSDIIVRRYLPPTSVGSFFAMGWFVALSGLIILWIFRGREAAYVGPFLADHVWNAQWKFDVTAFVHAGILVKKCRDVVNLAGRLRVHGVDRRRGVWALWLVNVALEGWRCAQRFEAEVRRVGRGMAEEKVKGESRKGK